MTDLPLLERLLVDAAIRRRRHRRARRVVTVVAAAAAVGVVALRLDPAVPDREVPAATTVEQAFSVFRRPARPLDRAPNAHPSDDSRLIARTGDVFVYLARRGDQLCLSTFTGPRGVGLTCGPAPLDPRRPLAAVTAERVVLAIPDGASDVTVRTGSGDPRRRTVRSNGLLIERPTWPVRLDWTTPLGPGHLEYAGPTSHDPADYYAVLRGPEYPSDRLAGLPGARRLADHGHVHVWLVPRRGAVCLLVRVTDAGREREGSGCRRDVTDIRHPLIVAVPYRPNRVVALIFPDGALGGKAEAENFMLIPDGTPKIGYRDVAGKPRLESFPDGDAGFVLHAEPMSPGELPGPG